MLELSLYRLLYWTKQNSGANYCQQYVNLLCVPGRRKNESKKYRHRSKICLQILSTLLKLKSGGDVRACALSRRSSRRGPWADIQELENRRRNHDLCMDTFRSVMGLASQQKNMSQEAAQVPSPSSHQGLISSS